MSNYAYNPFTSNLDLVGGGESYIDGVVATPASLPVTVGTPALDAVYLAKAGSGVWLINRRPAGLYCRVANNGNLADWVPLGAFPEVNADGNWALYNSADPTRELKFDLSGLTTGTTRTLTVPDASGTLIVSSSAPTDGDTLVWDDAAGEWVAASGGGGGEVRSDFVSPYTYIGLANAGTAENAASWYIRRSEFDANGTYISTTTATAVEWDDRLTASYS